MTNLCSIVLPDKESKRRCDICVCTIFKEHSKHIRATTTCHMAKDVVGVGTVFKQKFRNLVHS